MERYQIFEGISKLKPLCDSLCTKPSIQIVDELKLRVEEVSPGVAQDLQEYILLPLLIHLAKNEASKDAKLHFIQCLRTVVSKTRITKVDTLQKLFSSVTYQIFDQNEKSMVIQSYEELKENVLFCTIDLLCRSCTDVIEEFYVRKNVTKLGQNIYLCVSIAKLEKSQSLRLAAIMTMMTLAYVHDEADASDVILRSQVADIIMLFFPGIITGLQEAALGSEIQGHKIPMMALRAAGRILCLVMEDRVQADEEYDLGSLTTNETKSTDPLGISLKARDGMVKFMETASRTQEWLDAAAEKFNVCIRVLIALAKHSHFKVRKELAEFAGTLLLRCPRNMRANHRELVEILITLSEDDAEQVSNSARNMFNEIRKMYMQGNQFVRPVIETLEESFYTLLTKLPRVMRTSDHSEQMACLNQFGGYLKILGHERLPKMISSVAHLQRLILALVYSIELDCSSISLLEDVSIKDSKNIVHHHGFDSWRHFKFLDDVQAERKLQNICKLIGEFGNLRILTDTILDMASNMSRYRKELTLLLNWIIAVPVKDTFDLSVYQSIVDYLITPSLGNLCMTMTDEISLGEAQSNVVQCCIFLEGFEIIARTIKHEYQTFLLNTLYLVIEKAGSRQTLVSIAGFKCLSAFAEATGSVTIENLLKENVDYLSYHITLKLRRVERNPGVLDVIGIVTQQCTLDVLPCLEDIVQDVLAQSNVNYQERNTYSFLKVFHTFVTCVERLVKNESSRPAGTKIEVVDAVEEAIKTLCEHWEAKKNSENFDDNDDNHESTTIANDQQPDSYDNYQDEKKIAVPLHIRLTVSIVQRCIHFLPSKDISIKLLAIETLRRGVLILHSFEDELLPIVHQLWHPLVQRFRDASPIVINHSWGLLCTLAYVSRDFIRSRTLKEVIPALSEFLAKSNKESYRKDSGNAYKYTQVFKLQRELLTGLGDMVEHINLQERELWDILMSATPYLSKYQHLDLQRHCVRLFEKIADYNQDIVWAKCFSLSKPVEIENATISSLDISAVANFNIQNEYQVNIETIVTYIEDKSLNM